MPFENDSIDLVDRLVAEYADRQARDEDPRREELLAQAPQFRAELERCFRMIDGDGGEPHGGLAAGAELGDFRLVRELGRGGMAVVYEAEQKSLKRRVALKVLRHHLTLDAKHTERFQREARATARLAHPNVLAIHAVGQVDGHAYIAFELVRGPNLAQVIDGLHALGRRPTAADLARLSGATSLASAPGYAAACVRLLRGVFAGVGAAHAIGIIHRDLKPSNVLLDASGKPLVADFGLAKDMAEASLSLTGDTLGTPHYMAPEQASALTKLVDSRADVYSLGVTLYELLTLQRPFEGDTLRELVQSIATQTPRPPSEIAADIPSVIGDVVLKAMAKERELRYASVDLFAADLERALAGESVSAVSTSGLTGAITAWFDAQLRGASFEYRTRATIFGWPWIHVVVRIRDPRTGHPKWAKGVIAIGDQAIGVYAAGKFAVGFLALGFISIGVVGIGAIAIARNAIGGLAVGYEVLGGVVAGYSGRGLVSEWIAVATDVAAHRAIPAPHSGPPQEVLVFLAGSVVGGLMAYSQFIRFARNAPEKRYVQLVTRLWIPILCAIPLALRLGGVSLPYMAQVLIISVAALLCSLAIKRKLGLPRAASG